LKFTQTKDANHHKEEKMAKVKLNPLFEEVHGKFGDVIFRRTPGGGTIAYPAPEKSRGNTRSAQKYQQHHMNEAHAYAREAMDDPEMKSHYEQEAKKKHKSAYRLAFGNYFKVCRKMGE
jgi:hypothetical protein